MQDKVPYESVSVVRMNMFEKEDIPPDQQSLFTLEEDWEKLTYQVII